MDSNYSFYQAKIRQAERMRSEALAAYIDAAWQQAAKLVAKALHGVGNMLHGHHPLHH
jgi:uncharacterized protein HemY